LPAACDGWKSSLGLCGATRTFRNDLRIGLCSQQGQLLLLF